MIYIFDTECYKDYFLLMMRDVATGEVFSAESFPGKPFTVGSLPPVTLVGFNSRNYDFPILSLAMAGADNQTLKNASDDIIVHGLKPWHIRDKYGGVDLNAVDHIDLIEVAPGQCGLKAYGGRMHSRRLQDLPIDPSASISPTDRAVLRVYCQNDLETTLDLMNKVRPQLLLREKMSKEYGIDLRSKSDAQIAEAVIRSEVEKRLGHRVYRPELHPAYKFHYIAPAYIQFTTPGMRKVLDLVKASEFGLNDKGSVELPPVFESMRVCVGKGVYTMGIGGLHSNEYRTARRTRLIDRDVTSYYPSIILTQGLFPQHMGPDFLAVYRSIVERRIAAKVSGDAVTNESLKVVINGSFGKLGSKWSILYAPDLMIQVTLTGQLCLLMLIEMVEAVGIPVVSANTDGVVMDCAVEEQWLLDAVIAHWEHVTGFNTEQTEYRALYSKDVNNYIALKSDGSVKLKGEYTPSGLQKNNTNTVCTNAVIAYLTEGVPLQETIRGCKDIRDFLTIRQVKGGGQYDGKYLGKAVRWYYTNSGKNITSCIKGDKVAKSDGCTPLMTLPDTLPEDIDYQWYVVEAQSMLDDMGA